MFGKKTWQFSSVKKKFTFNYEVVNDPLVSEGTI